MLPPVDITTALEPVSNELANAAIACAKYGLVCTTQPEFDKFTYVVGFVGIIIGVIACLGFQYFKKKADAKVAAYNEEMRTEEHKAR